MINQQYCKLCNRTSKKKNKLKDNQSQKHEQNENMIIDR